MSRDMYPLWIRMPYEARVPWRTTGVAPFLTYCPGAGSHGRANPESRKTSAVATIIAEIGSPRGSSNDGDSRNDSGPTGGRRYRPVTAIILAGVRVRRPWAPRRRPRPEARGGVCVAYPRRHLGKSPSQPRATPHAAHHPWLRTLLPKWRDPYPWIWALPRPIPARVLEGVAPNVSPSAVASA